MNPCDRKVSTLLQCARDLISDPKKWTQGVLARTRDGDRVHPTDENACSFCSIGAIEKCLPHPTNFILYDKAIGVMYHHMNGGIAVFNDGSSHERVLAAFDEAIKEVKQKEKDNG